MICGVLTKKVREACNLLVTGVGALDCHDQYGTLCSGLVSISNDRLRTFAVDATKTDGGMIRQTCGYNQ